MPVVLDQNLLNQDTSLIRLVQGDTSPPLVVTVKKETVNQVTGQTIVSALDISNSTTRLKIRIKGDTEVHDIVNGVLLDGLEMPDGTINTTAPYNVLGAGGRVVFFWNNDSLSFVGDAEGEIEVTYNTGDVLTGYNLLRFRLRAQF